MPESTKNEDKIPATGTAADELSEDELDAVAGGTGRADDEKGKGAKRKFAPTWGYIISV